MSNIVTYNDWFNVAPYIVDKTINPSGETIIDKNISPIPDTNNVDETYFKAAMNITMHKNNTVIDKVTGVEDCRDIVDSVQVYKAWEDAYPTNMNPVDNEEELYKDTIREMMEEKPIEIEKVETIDNIVESENSISDESIDEIIEKQDIDDINDIIEDEELPTLPETNTEDISVIIPEQKEIKKETEKKPVKRTTRKKTIETEKKETTSKPRKTTRKTTKVKENK